jgi:excisionase family DNA binding protein
MTATQAGLLRFLRGWTGMPEWLSVKEAAELSGYHANYIRKLIRKNQIEAEKKGPMWWIDKDSLRAYLEAAQSHDDKRYGPRTEPKLLTE